ncbi:hypothetical protein ACTXT7_012970 [Hymenolepis weldensis]
MNKPVLHTPSPIWIPAGAEASFEGVPISNAIQYGHLAACSDRHLAVATGFNAGGSVALLDLSKLSLSKMEIYHPSFEYDPSTCIFKTKGR